MRTLKNWSEMDRMKVGETVRLAPSLRTRSVRVEGNLCGACGHAFTLIPPETPKFCPRCGSRWNGKAPAAAVEED